MHIEMVAFRRGERQGIQECQLALIELLTRPLDRDHRLVVHARRGADRRAVVIADERDRAARDERLDGVDGESRIGAVADIVAEKYEAVDAAAGGVSEAGFEGLTIAVDVGEQRNQHDPASRQNLRHSRANAKRRPRFDRGRRSCVAIGKERGVYCVEDFGAVGDGAPIGRVGAWLLTGRGGV